MREQLLNVLKMAEEGNLYLTEDGKKWLLLMIEANEELKIG